VTGLNLWVSTQVDIVDTADQRISI